jgi:hypothetical protein
MAAKVLERMGRPKKRQETEYKVIAIRGTPDWHEWVFQLAEFRRTPVTSVIDQALVEYAERHGFKKPAPSR